MAVAEANSSEWAVGFEDECWWSRLALPTLSSWTEEGKPLRLIQPSVENDDPDPKAISCYGLYLPEFDQTWLRFVDGRPVSSITTQFLWWCCEKLQAAGKKVLVEVRPARDSGGRRPWQWTCMDLAAKRAALRAKRPPEVAALAPEEAHLIDEQWALVHPLLPPQSGGVGRPPNDHRVILGGILWVARTGSSWREMPDEFGKWESASEVEIEILYILSKGCLHVRTLHQELVKKSSTTLMRSNDEKVGQRSYWSSSQSPKMPGSIRLLDTSLHNLRFLSQVRMYYKPKEGTPLHRPTARVDFAICRIDFDSSESGAMGLSGGLVG